MANRKCTQIGHENSFVDRICIKPDCKHSRFMCADTCGFKLHSEHKFISLKNFHQDSAIHNLVINSGKQDSSETRGPQVFELLRSNLQYVQEKKKQINTVFKQMESLLEDRLESVLTAAVNSFRKQSLIQRSQRLINSNATEQQAVRFVRDVNGMGQQHMRNMNQLYQKAHVLKWKMEYVIEVLYQQLSNSLTKFTSDILECDLFSKQNLQKLQMERYQQQYQRQKCEDQRIQAILDAQDRALIRMAEKNQWDSITSQIKGQIKLVQKLEHVQIKQKQMKQIPQCIQALKNVKYLSFYRNYIPQIKNLGKLTNITQLNLASNQIYKIENLDRLSSLVKLDLYGNRIAVIENLHKLTELKALFLGSNQITEIKGLQGLKQLQELNLSYNKIRKIDDLSYLSKLNTLYLSYNQIDLIENLLELKSLSYVNVFNNPAINYKPYRDKDNTVELLRKRNVQVQW